MNENTSKKLKFALSRAVAALLLAGALLAFSGFGIIDLFRGAYEAPIIQNQEQGAFVSREISMILGIYADEVSSSGNVTAQYAVIYMGGEFVSVRFTPRYLESAGAVLKSTYDYINGKKQSADSYVTVEGTVSTLSEKSSGLMYDWFGLNKAQLVEIGAIGETDDYAEYLSDTVLLVDTVGGRSISSVIALSAIAGVLLLYVLVELILMGTGAYLPKPATDDAESDDDTDDDTAPKASFSKGGGGRSPTEDFSDDATATDDTPAAEPSTDESTGDTSDDTSDDDNNGDAQ